MRKLILLAFVLLLVISLNSVCMADQLVRYMFGEGSGDIVHDSAPGAALDLIIDNPANVSWMAGGGLSVDSPTIVVSPGPATKVIDGCMATNEITIEAWIKPASDEQGGPARIVTCSFDGSFRNFTLGQDITSPSKGYQIRLRTPVAGLNGSDVRIQDPPDTVVLDRMSKLVYTRNAAGEAKFYIDGTEVASKQIDGDFSNWDASYQLALANEIPQGGTRLWLGSFYYVAIYNEAIAPEQLPAPTAVEPQAKMTTTWAEIKALR